MPVSACLFTCMTADTSSLLSVGAAMSPIESRQIFRALNKTWIHTHISQAAGAGVVSWRKHGGPLGGEDLPPPSPCPHHSHVVGDVALGVDARVVEDVEPVEAQVHLAVLCAARADAEEAGRVLVHL